MPYQLKDFGSFYLAGKTILVEGEPIKEVYRNKDFPNLQIDVNGDYVIEQAYVQYYIPIASTKRLPVIFVHGGGHTGSVWEMTADGRQGWLHYFLKQGYPVYVIDNVERGRAGWSCLPGVWEEEPDLRSGKHTWTMFRLGPEEGYDQRLPFPNQQFPITAFNNLLHYNVPRWNTHAEPSTQALVKLCNRVGPCIVIVHSQSGAFGLDALNETPESIQGVVFLEPASFGAVSHACQNKPLLYLYGDYIEEFEIWKKLYHLALKQKEALERNGAIVEWVELPKQNILGNSHMPMMDHNHLDIAEIVHQWICKVTV